MKRLSVAVLGVGLYLVVGGALAIDCFMRADPSYRSIWNGTTPPNDQPPPPTPPKLPVTTVPVSDEEQQKIDAAIVKGVWYLRKTVKDGGWGTNLPANNDPVAVGFAALPALTLLECGVSPQEKIIQDAATLVRQNGMQSQQQYDTYQRALAILFLDPLGEPEDESRIQYLALCLIAGQQADNGWTYFCPALEENRTAGLLQDLAGKKQSLADWKKKALNGGAWQRQASDNSNTQFAILALWVAQRHGVEIEEIAGLVDQRFRGSQFKVGVDPEGHVQNLEGGWYYSTTDNAQGWQSGNVWPSMTCAGLLALAIAHGAGDGWKSKDRPLLDDPAVKSALGMLGREIARPNDTRTTDLYYLWSLERVGVLYDLEKIEGKDWYAWGRGQLLATQQENGAWSGGYYYGNNPMVNTCFALLFLKQANLAPDLSQKIGLLNKK